MRAGVGWGWGASASIQLHSGTGPIILACMRHVASAGRGARAVVVCCRRSMALRSTACMLRTAAGELSPVSEIWVGGGCGGDHLG